MSFTVISVRAVGCFWHDRDEDLKCWLLRQGESNPKICCSIFLIWPCAALIKWQDDGNGFSLSS